MSSNGGQNETHSCVFRLVWGCSTHCHEGEFVYYILRSIFGPSLLQTQNMNIVKSHVVYDLLMHGLLEERSDIQGGNFKVESIR